jgi:hypothetical protein
VSFSNVALTLITISCLTSCATSNNSRNPASYYGSRDAKSVQEKSIFLQRKLDDKRKEYFETVKSDGFEIKIIRKANIDESAEMYRGAGENILTNEYFANSNQAEVSAVLTNLIKLIRPLPYKGELKPKLSKESDEIIMHRVNRSVALRGFLIAVAAQVVNKYSDKYPEIFDEEIVEGFMNTAKYDSRSINRRMASLGVLALPIDSQRKVQFLDYISENDGKIIFDGLFTSKLGAEYSFKEAKMRNGEFVLKLPTLRPGIHDLSEVDFLNCNNEWSEYGVVTCEKPLDIAVEDLTLSERNEKVYDAVNHLVETIQKRQKKLKDPSIVEVRRIFSDYISRINRNLNQARSDLKKLENSEKVKNWDAYKAKEIDRLSEALEDASWWRSDEIKKRLSYLRSSEAYVCAYEQECKDLVRTIESLKREKLEAYGAEVPEPYVRELEDMLKAAKGMRRSLGVVSIKTSNGTTLILSENTKKYAQKWKENLSDFDFVSELGRMILRDDVGGILKAYRLSEVQ